MQVHIVVPGAGQDDPVTIKDVSCTDTTTVRDALKAAELKGYVLRNKDGDFLSEGQVLRSSVEDGTKLFAIPEMKVGRALA